MDLATWMKAHGISDYALGKLLGRPSQTVRRWRIGENRPRTPADLEAIRQVTGGKVTAASFWAVPVPDQGDAA